MVARQSVLSLKAAMRKMTLDEDDIEEVLARAGLQPEEPQYGAFLGLESALSPPPRSERLERGVRVCPRSGLIWSGLAATLLACRGADKAGVGRADGGALPAARGCT